MCIISTHLKAKGYKAEVDESIAAKIRNYEYLQKRMGKANESEYAKVHQFS